MPEQNKYPLGYGEARVRLMASRRAKTHASYLLPYLKPNMEVLDLGCGPGTISMDFAEMLTEGKLVGVDIEQTQIDVASYMSGKRGLSNTQFQVIDVLRGLPFEDARFDVVHTHAVLHHLPDPLGVLREMKRVLRPGGMLAVSEPIIKNIICYPESDELAKHVEMYVRYAREELDLDYNLGLRLRELYFKAGIFNFTTTSMNEVFVDQLLQDVSATIEEDWKHADFNQQLIEKGYATQTDATTIQKMWRKLAQSKASFLSIPFVEMIGKTV